MFCHVCGNIVAESADFCNKCGTKQIKDEPTPIESMPTPMEHSDGVTLGAKKTDGIVISKKTVGICLSIIALILVVLIIIFINQGSEPSNDVMLASDSIVPATDNTPTPTPLPAPRLLTEDEARAIVREWLNNHPDVGHPPYIFDSIGDDGEFFTFIMDDGMEPGSIILDRKTGDMLYHQIIYDEANDSYSYTEKPLDEWYIDWYGTLYDTDILSGVWTCYLEDETRELGFSRGKFYILIHNKNESHAEVIEGYYPVSHGSYQALDLTITDYYVVNTNYNIIESHSEGDGSSIYMQLSIVDDILTLFLAEDPWMLEFYANQPSGFWSLN